MQVDSQSLERFEQAQKKMQAMLPKSLRVLRISRSDAFRALVEFYLDDDEPIISQEYFEEQRKLAEKKSQVIAKYGKKEDLGAKT